MNDKEQPEEQDIPFVPVFDVLPRDPKIVNDEELVYGTLHGLPGYEEEWRRRNYSEEKSPENEENFDGYDGNY